MVSLEPERNYSALFKLAHYRKFQQLASPDRLANTTRPEASTPCTGAAGRSRGSGHDGSSRRSNDRNIAVETQSTEPPVGQIEGDFLAQPPLGANAEDARSARHPTPTHRLLADVPDSVAPSTSPSQDALAPAPAELVQGRFCLCLKSASR